MSKRYLLKIIHFKRNNKYDHSNSMMTSNQDIYAGYIGYDQDDEDHIVYEECIKREE